MASSMACERPGESGILALERICVQVGRGGFGWGSEPVDRCNAIIVLPLRSRYVDATPTLSEMTPPIAFHTWFITANNKAGQMEWQQQAISSEELVDLIDEALEEGLSPTIELC